MVDPIAAEARAVESGAHAIQNPDGSFRVRSASRKGVTYRVVPAMIAQGSAWIVRFECECESGRARPSDPVPCWHAALVGRRLERIGWASWTSGFWFATEIALVACGLALPKPPAKKVKGRCPVCHAFLTIDYADDEKRTPQTVAAAHDPKCNTEYARRRVRVAGELQAYERSAGKPLDPWQR